MAIKRLTAAFVKTAKAERRGLGYFIFAFLAALFTLTDFGKRLWLDLIYAGAVAVAAPFAITYAYMAL
jgi:hypothetical protein